jgi:hypothetical protein
VLYDATATLSNGATIYHATATWNIDNSGVAVINSNGVLTGLGLGTVTITATYRGKSATATVRVSANTSKPFPGSANLVIALRPDPAPGFLTPCRDASWMGQPPAFWIAQTPTWSPFEIIRETQGVGFTLQLETLNFHNQDGLLISQSSVRRNRYFPPNSEFDDGDGCMALGGSPSGFFETILDGVDDRGNYLTFASNRLRLSPVAGVR